jgi:anti-sigma factor (TIGR02949 family)
VNCAELQSLIHGYLDGELDLVHHLEIERHLQECPVCTAVLNQQQALQQAIRGAALYRPAPVELRQRIQSSLRRAGPSQNGLGRLARNPLRWTAALAASLVFLALLGWGLVRVWSIPSQQDLLAQQIVSSHVRSLLAKEPVDRPTSDTHMLKPWLSTQLGFSPVVKDLTAQGFPLAGARLDYLDNQKVVALVYHRHQHRINVFIWPTIPDMKAAPRVLTRQGYHLISWTQDGLTYWAISDVNEKELQEFVELLRR